MMIYLGLDLYNNFRARVAVFIPQNFCCFFSGVLRIGGHFGGRQENKDKGLAGGGWIGHFSGSALVFVLVGKEAKSHDLYLRLGAMSEWYDARSKDPKILGKPNSLCALAID